jgi:hypothetical protein
MLSIVAVMMLAGCGYAQNAGETVAEYTLPDGTKVSWRSNKQQQGFKARIHPDGTFQVEVDESGSQESVLKAMAEGQARLIQALERAAAIGAMAAPVPR